MTVAVLVDGIRGIDENGDPTYQERSPEELERLALLVRNTVGFQENRGDSLEVISMPFADVGEIVPDMAEDTFFGFTSRDITEITKILLLAVVAILVMLLIVRPLVSRLFETLPAAQDMMEKKLLAEPVTAEGQPALTGPPAPAPAGRGPDTEQEELINLSQVEGRVKASSVKKIGEIVDKHPEEALSIIRNWLYQET